MKHFGGVPHQVHAVSEVSDFLFAGLNNPFDVVDPGPKICQLALQLGLLLQVVEENKGLLFKIFKRMVN